MLLMLLIPPHPHPFFLIYSFYYLLCINSSFSCPPPSPPTQFLFPSLHLELLTGNPQLLLCLQERRPLIHWQLSQENSSRILSSFQITNSARQLLTQAPEEVQTGQETNFWYPVQILACNISATTTKIRIIKIPTMPLWDCKSETYEHY